VRHGESKGNTDATSYTKTPDPEIALTERGIEQAKEAGKILKACIGDGKVRFWVSPHKRSRQTSQEILAAFSKDDYTLHEEPRIREQDFGNFQNLEEQKKMHEERKRYGRFNYRFPHGESGADVYDRVSSFMDTMHRYFDTHPGLDAAVLVSHGITCRIFLMRFLRWSIETSESMQNLDNCEIVVLERNDEGWYRIVSDVRTRKPAKELDESNFQGWYAKHAPSKQHNPSKSSLSSPKTDEKRHHGSPD
jgi:broad specificity phosphatase PhoE